MSDAVPAAWLEWAYACGVPQASGVIRTTPEDFFVDEIPVFEPDGEGQHALLHIEKRGCNTDWLAKQLARHAGVKAGAVSYAGLKDRHAVTRQWFSVDLAGKPEPDWGTLEVGGEGEKVTVLAVTRHRRKVRRGALRGNRFRLRVRGMAGDSADLAERLEYVQQHGVPNYFGEQRFGHHFNNLDRALAMFRGEFKVRDRHKRGLYLSAARSLIFNRVLSARVEQGSWHSLLEGERVILDGSERHFALDPADAEIPSRLAAFDIHPSGPLWGEGGWPPEREAAVLEAPILAEMAEWCEGLERARMDYARRSLRLAVRELEWSLEGDTLELAFSLEAGAYATTVLRELVTVEDASRQAASGSA